jgi:hypothetical protein
MRRVETMTGKTGSEPGPNAKAPISRPASGDRPIGLDYRYGEIGIVAVAAALRYSSTGRTPADAPAAPRLEQRFIETAI